MKKANFSVVITSALFALFALLCTLPFNISFVFLNAFFLGLTILLVWMVVSVLKHSEPSKHTFDERFYDDL